jgi:hypothetical protein
VNEGPVRGGKSGTILAVVAALAKAGIDLESGGVIPRPKKR